MADMNVQPKGQSNPELQETIESSCWKKIASERPAIKNYRIVGICPNCKHDTYWKVSRGTVFGFTSSREDEASTTFDVSCICNTCTVNSVEDTNRTGCGWNAKIAFNICNE
jgi:hypothetical protein